jgi:hypothetical protein
VWKPLRHPHQGQKVDEYGDTLVEIFAMISVTKKEKSKASVPGNNHSPDVTELLFFRYLLHDDLP